MGGGDGDEDSFPRRPRADAGLGQVDQRAVAARVDQRVDVGLEDPCGQHDQLGASVQGLLGAG